MEVGSVSSSSGQRFRRRVRLRPGCRAAQKPPKAAAGRTAGAQTSEERRRADDGYGYQYDRVSVGFDAAVLGVGIMATAISASGSAISAGTDQLAGSAGQGNADQAEAAARALRRAATSATGGGQRPGKCALLAGALESGTD